MQLNLQKHSEGGYYRRVYLQAENLVSSIYYLLAAGEKSYFHSMGSDEILLFHCGSPLKVKVLDQMGKLHNYQLGNAILAGENAQLIIKAGEIFAMQALTSEAYSLISCVVAPAFSFEKFKLYSYQELITNYPHLTQENLNEFCVS